MKKALISFTFVYFLFAVAQQANAQCAMCKATVESNIKENGNFLGKGLNTGILYLMSIPYILGTVGFGIYYFNRKKK